MYACPLRAYLATLAIAAGSSAQLQLFDNGPIATPFSGYASCLPPGSTASEVPWGNTNAGWNASAVLIEGGFSVTDDFEVPAGTVWHVRSIRFPTYQVAVTTASVNDLRLRIWRGRPGDAGSVVVFGDLESNRLDSNNLTPLYRIFPAQCATLRRMQSVRADAEVTLPPGVFWLEWCAAGTSWSGPWAPAVTIEGVPGQPGANARHKTWEGWSDAIDGGVAQDFAFVVEGTTQCYPDCNGDGALTSPDFACFQTRFAVFDPYADCSGNGALSIADFACFQMRFVMGCP